VDALSLNLYFYKGLDEKSSLFYGAEVVSNEVGSSARKTDIITGDTEPTSTRYPDGSDWASYAAYLNFKSNLSEQLTFVAGARYNRVALDTSFDKTFYPFPFDDIHIDTGALNGSIGLVFRPSDTWQLNFNAATGFRAPNIDDAAKVFDSAPGTVVVPNENLKPEYVWNFDMGVVKSLCDRVRVEATAFYTRLHDAMVRRDFRFNGHDYILYDGELSRVQAIVNAEEAAVYGLQFALEAALTDGWSLKTFLNITRGETREGEPLRHVPPTFGSTHLIYERGRLTADFYADYNGEIPFENLAPSELDKPHIYAQDANGNPYSPAWFTLNLKVNYRLSDSLLLSAGLENFLDQRYRPYSSGIVAPGRNLIIALRSSF